MPVFGTADTMAETQLPFLSLNCSMKSYLLQVNILLQNNWRAIGHRSRRDGEKIKECWKSKVVVFFFNSFHLYLFFLFFCIIHTISSKDPINPQDELLSPAQVPSSLRVMREMGSAVFIPSWDRKDLVDLVPREMALIAFFCRNHRTRHSPSWDQQVWEDIRMAMGKEYHFPLNVSAAKQWDKF